MYSTVVHKRDGTWEVLIIISSHPNVYIVNPGLIEGLRPFRNGGHLAYVRVSGDAVE